MQMHVMKARTGPTGCSQAGATARSSPQRGACSPWRKSRLPCGTANATSSNTPACGKTMRTVTFPEESGLSSILSGSREGRLEHDA